MEYARLLKINFNLEFSVEQRAKKAWQVLQYRVGLLSGDRAGGVSRQGWDTPAIQHGIEPQGWNVTSTAHQGMVLGGDGSEEPRAGL